MKQVPNEIIEIVMKDLIKDMYFPFSWGRETLRYLYFFQKGEEENLLKSFETFKTFQEWSKKNEETLYQFIQKINLIRDMREEFLKSERKKILEIEITKVIDTIKEFIYKNQIPINEDTKNLSISELGSQNFIWEALSFYLKNVKFITYSLNFSYYASLSADFQFIGKKNYQLNTLYKVKEEISFLQSLILALSGIPCKEELIVFSLPKDIQLEGTLERKEIIWFDKEHFIFHK
ncbi:MAG TPA: DNA repair protein Rad50 [Dictyoglomaceae bacterium]|nr:DNA repair protein Rad50 [Dictyoglomaceae bacterium]HOL39163.1 DNA repair protein Rad50 [Dictyoglomaceae bacterium]HOP94228.1 DNA repair protein Rad50 [Dictyoglomaceae bacterium]HPP15317.1 DNA repair protein Rad50 [Dictyoglomaceae bacterium]HPU42724.1 DNA repair protein Rad50 [Dictyoglomaceae bacterium]